MKLYKTTYTAFGPTAFGATSANASLKSTWHGSASDASKERTRLKSENRNSAPSTADVEVPVVKAGLLAFLNNLTS